MHKRKGRAFPWALLSLCLSSALPLHPPAAVQAAEVIPVYDLNFFSGQHFYNGDVSSLSGNVNLMLSPAVKFNDKWSLVPTYAGGYQGTRDVQDLAGGGTLFQDSTAHGLTVKGVYSATPSWKLKLTGGARAEFLRETEDERWGKGLFDYRKYTGGVETEYDFSKNAGTRLAYDYYMLNFPNYQSLESSQDPTLSRELAGEDVLDSGNHMVTLGGWAPLPGRVRAELTIYANRRGYDDQPVVNAAGSLTAEDRRDTTLALSSNFIYPLAWGRTRLVGELSAGYGRTDSNQNHYDARKTLFLGDYYDYDQISAGPRLTAALGSRPWIVSLGAGYTLRRYGDRPIQNANGDYLSEKLRMAELSTSLGIAYPIGKNFKVRAVSTLAWSDSNMEYEKVFRYNYKIANYLFGFSYDY